MCVWVVLNCCTEFSTIPMFLKWTPRLYLGCISRKEFFFFSESVIKFLGKQSQEIALYFFL